MIDCQLFYDSLTRNGVGFFTGVPDSLSVPILPIMYRQKNILLPPTKATPLRWPRGITWLAKACRWCTCKIPGLVIALTRLHL